ncbi:hypothetical protein CC84DRAFT_876608 [Paraphaeosphaeria sporulosa]|uniref:Secreted protein n=1 Tax=Paraphaeosphaeria sporulosa TaxID=1460663 RepID=A0A177C8S8_9PLEO|nr:hypothetical protein CC84DRAFT_876608 [Paraphaeosphaeria sporulosa]
MFLFSASVLNFCASVGLLVTWLGSLLVGTHANAKAQHPCQYFLSTSWKLQCHFCSWFITLPYLENLLPDTSNTCSISCLL